MCEVNISLQLAQEEPKAQGTQWNSSITLVYCNMQLETKIKVVKDSGCFLNNCIRTHKPYETPKYILIHAKLNLPFKIYLCGIILFLIQIPRHHYLIQEQHNVQTQISPHIDTHVPILESGITLILIHQKLKKKKGSFSKMLYESKIIQFQRNADCKNSSSFFMDGYKHTCQSGLARGRTVLTQRKLSLTSEWFGGTLRESMCIYPSYIVISQTSRNV